MCPYEPQELDQLIEKGEFLSNTMTALDNLECGEERNETGTIGCEKRVREMQKERDRDHRSRIDNVASCEADPGTPKTGMIESCCALWRAMEFTRKIVRERQHRLEPTALTYCCVHCTCNPLSVCARYLCGVSNIQRTEGSNLRCALCVGSASRVHTRWK